VNRKSIVYYINLVDISIVKIVFQAPFLVLITDCKAYYLWIHSKTLEAFFNIL